MTSELYQTLKAFSDAAVEKMSPLEKYLLDRQTNLALYGSATPDESVLTEVVAEQMRWMALEVQQ